VLGVDDFALAKGYVYGTVLVDMRTGDVAGLLPDREAASFQAWLTAHPGARITAGPRPGEGHGHKPGPHRWRQPGPGGPVVTDLVTRARNGDKQAWDALVERYAPLIWSICRRYGLGDADAEDVSQNVWLKLVDQLEKIRLPAALPGWLATTTRRECGRILRVPPGARDIGQVPDAQAIPDDDTQTAEEELLAAELRAALREAFAELPPCCQQLIALLTGNPLRTYAMYDFA
jgi:RNA polymerase sigma factor (sigma-70 family)